LLLRNDAGLNMKRVLLATAALVSLGFLSTIAQAPSALSGVIDIHAHTDPDSRPRSIDALDLAKMAKARGMRGLVLKNHFESTAAQAYLVRKDVPGLEVFGGIDLNLTVGGINPAAVEHMVQITAVQNKSGCAEGALLQLDIDRP